MPSLSVEGLISMAVGGLVTWGVAWWYYKRAGDELRTEAASLRTATDAILYIQQNPGATVDVDRDASGRVVGLLVGVSGKGDIAFAMSGTLTDGSSPKGAA